MRKDNLLNGSEALKLYKKQKKFPLVTSNVAEVLDDEKACKKAAELCARKLEKVFLRLEKEYSGQEILDVYEDGQGIKIINELLKMESKKVDRKKLFEYLEIKLGNMGYESKKSWYGYFTDSPFGGRGAWFTMSRKNKIVGVNN